MVNSGKSMISKVDVARIASKRKLMYQTLNLDVFCFVRCCQLWCALFGLVSKENVSKVNKNHGKLMDYKVDGSELKWNQCNALCHKWQRENNNYINLAVVVVLCMLLLAIVVACLFERSPPRWSNKQEKKRTKKRKTFIGPFQFGIRFHQSQCSIKDR